MSDFRLPEEIRQTILEQGLALQREVAFGVLASLTTDQREAVFNLYWVLEEAGIAPALSAGVGRRVHRHSRRPLHR